MSRSLSAARVSALSAAWPAGSRVELVSLEDPHPGRLRPGCLGSVVAVDSLGTVHVAWDCGSSLGLVPGVDQWRAAPVAASIPAIVAAAQVRSAAPAPAVAGSPVVVAGSQVRSAVLASVAEVVGAINGRLWVPPAYEVLGLLCQSGEPGVAAVLESAFADVDAALGAALRLLPPAAAAPVAMDLVGAFSAVAAAVASAALAFCQPGPDDENCPVCGGSV